MAKFEIVEDEGTRFVRATLDNETIQAERGALCYMFGRIQVDARVPSVGWMVRSLLSEESLIRPTYTGSGVIYLDSSFAGFHTLHIKEKPWILESGTYWASDASVSLHVFRESLVTSFWAGEGFFDFQTRVSGDGQVILRCEGPVEEVQLQDQELLCEGKYVVARTEGITYRIRRVARSWIRSKLAGEGRVRVYEGTGTALVVSYPYWKLRMIRKGLVEK